MTPHELVEQWRAEVGTHTTAALHNEDAGKSTQLFIAARVFHFCAEKLHAALEEQKPSREGELGKAYADASAELLKCKQQLDEAREAQRELLTVMADCRDAFTARSPEESKAMKYLDEAVMKYAPKLVLGLPPKQRAEYIAVQLAKAPDGPAKVQYLQAAHDKGLLSDQTLEHLAFLVESAKRASGQPKP